MFFPGNRTERTNLVVGVVSCIAGVAGTMLAFYIYLQPSQPVKTDVSTDATVKTPADMQLRSQAPRTAAMSFRAISGERVGFQKSASWQAAELQFQMGNSFYSKRDYEKAGYAYDAAQRAFNDIYVFASQSDAVTASALNQNSSKIQRYINQLDKEIAELERKRVRASPLEANLPGNDITFAIDEQLKTLRASREEARRRLFLNNDD
jgi:hypothetical protein